MSLRKLILKVHLYLGLASAVFLSILGLTGAIIAFEGDVDHWMRPGLWYAKGGPQTLPKATLIKAVGEKFAPARVMGMVIFRQPGLVHLMQMSDRAFVYVNPYDGTIQGRTTGPSSAQAFFQGVHQIHLRLSPNQKSSFTPIGKPLLSYSGLVLVIMVPTGLVLWWRTKRASIKTGGSWFRICFDLHNALGIYAALFLFVAGVTGVLIGFDWGEEAIYAATKSEPPDFRTKPPQSTPQQGATPIDADRALEIARGAMPDSGVAGIQLPQGPKATYTVLMRVPEETSESVHSSVMIDQFSGQVLKVRDFRTWSRGYYWIRFNRSVHTGDVMGTPTHILMSLSSLLLVVMAVTGIVIWWKKLAI